MSYEKLGFTSGQTLMAEHLNHMEDGIANAGGVLVVKTNEDFTQVLTPLNDIRDAAFNGTPVYIFKHTENEVDMYTLTNAQIRGDNGNFFCALFILVDDGDISFIDISETGEIASRRVLFDTSEDSGR